MFMFKLTMETQAGTNPDYCENVRMFRTHSEALEAAREYVRANYRPGWGDELNDLLAELEEYDFTCQGYDGAFWPAESWCWLVSID